MRCAIPSLAAFLAALALLAACGEKEEPATTGPVVGTPPTTSTGTPCDLPLPFQEVAAYFLTEVSPCTIDVCTDALTASFLRETYGDEQGCLASRSPESLATDAGLTVRPAQGNRATATADPTGGVYDGDRLAIALLMEGGQWRIDSVESNVPAGP